MPTPLGGAVIGGSVGGGVARGRGRMADKQSRTHTTELCE